MNYLQEATQEYARCHGALDTSIAWILTPFDVWVANPSYNGPRVPHPEDECWYDDVDPSERLDAPAPIAGEWDFSDDIPF